MYQTSPTMANYNANASYEAMLAAQIGGTIIVVYMLVALAAAVLQFVGWWKVFKKAGEAGWKCLIPIYNTYVLLQIVGLPWYFLLLMLIPGVNVVIMFVMYYQLAQAFGKGVGTMLGLTFLPFIFFPILGLGKAKYKKPSQANLS